MIFLHFLERDCYKKLFVLQVDSNILTNYKNVIYIVTNKYIVNIFLSEELIVAY